MTDPSTRHQVNLLDFLAFLLRWRRFLLTATLSVSVVVAIISFVLPPRFRSTAIIRPQESSGQGGIGALIASKLGNLGGLASLAPSLGEVPGEVLVAILKSRWMSDRVIEQFKLREVYEMEDSKQEEVVKALLALTDFDLDDISGNVVVRVDDKDPKRAKLMTDFYVDELDVKNQDLRSTAARREREFTGMRLDAEKIRLSQLEDSMSAFQEATGILNLEEQVRASVQAYSTIEASRLAVKSELDIKQQVLGYGHPESNYLRLQLASIDSSKQVLLRSHKGGSADFLIALDDVPTEGLTYLRLLRDIETQQLLVAYLLQQFEQSKVDELRNTPTVIRLDPPIEATQRIWPRRGLMVGIAFACTLMFAVAIALFLEMLNRAASEPGHPQHGPLLRVREAWASGKQRHGR